MLTYQITVPKSFKEKASEDKALIYTRGNVIDNILSSLGLRDDNRSSFAYKAINASVERLGVGRYQFYTWRLLSKPSIKVMANITVLISTTILYNQHEPCIVHLNAHKCDII